MDNQFYPPNGGYPQGQTPQQGYVPQGYGTQMQQPVANPYGGYGMQQEAGYQQQGQTGQYNPYDLQQSGYGAYTQSQPVVQGQNPYQQTGYQQPYAEAGYQYHFDHGQSVMQELPPVGFPPQMVQPQRPRLQLTPFHVAIIVAALGFLGWYLYATLVPEADIFLYYYYFLNFIEM